ncbi:MAG TPA: hypothetical protein VNB90_13655 [Cytophagaceae bacterium]|nr:hypothetical protein [Cytophagaceae bacterium]
MKNIFHFISRAMFLNSKFKILNLKFLLPLLFIASAAVAQDDDALKGTLRIEKNAKIELPEANRNFEKINNVQPVQPAKPLDYQPQEVELLLPRLDTKVKIVTIKSQDLTKLYGNYVKAGFGNYTSPYFEGFFNNKRSEKYSYGVHAKHFSSANGPVKNSGLSENQLEAYGKYFGKNTIIRGNAGYQRNRYNFYGYDHVREPNASGDSLKQVFNTFVVSAGIENKNKQNVLNYNTDVNYYNFSTYTGAREHEFLWNLKSDYWLDSDKSILLDASLSSSKRSDSSSISRTLFTAKPALQYKVNDAFSLIGGINLAYANDTINGYPKFHLYPRLNAEYKLAENKAIAFAGIDGEMQKNTLRTLSRENPYLGSDIALFHTNKTFDFYAGLKGGLKGGVTYKVKLSTANYKYLYFFNNGFTDTSKFTVLYNKNNINVLNIGGELGYEMSRQFRLAMATAYYSYTMGSNPALTSPWHRPNFTGSVLATYNLNQKVYFNADFYYIGGLKGKNYLSGQEINLKGIADLNFKIDYLFSKSFSAFIEVNNILSQKYQRYLYYPSKGINVLVGLTYSF